MAYGNVELTKRREELVAVIETYATDARVRDWLKKKREELIDVSKRNSLLYFKASETSTVKLTEPAIDTLLRLLVLEGKTLQFYPSDPEQNLLDFDSGETESPLLPLLPAEPRPLRADEVRSSLLETRLRRNLYSLRQKGRTSVAERGIVTLHVAFGFLEWTESENSVEKYRSPLLLAPVDLKRASSQSPYRLQVFEENLYLNPTLAYKMQQDGLTLPPLPSDLDEFDLNAYFAEVTRSIKQHRGWSVVAESYMGLFTFPKIVIYDDPVWETAGENALVRALAGDRSRLPVTPSDLPTENTIDELVLPQETFQIVDADASQQQAIQAARRGVSFVLQGPPGTGKSQTITNIIAETLAQGKKVLFVSEKMAALEVVHDRLTENGLGHFCLEAHSQKANKSQILNELNLALQSANTAHKSPPVDFTRLESARNTLNLYANALHEEQAPSGLTPFEVCGKLAQLETAPDLYFDVPDAFTRTPENRTRLDDVLYQLELAYPVLAAAQTHPWRGVTSHAYSLQLRADINAHFTPLIKQLQAFHELAQSLADACGVNAPVGMDACGRLLALATLVVQTPLPPADWFQPNALAPLIEKAQIYQASFENYQDRRKNLLIWWTENVFALPHEEIAERLTSRNQRVLERMQAGGQSAADTLIRQREAVTSALQHLSELLERLMVSVPMLARLCGLDTPEHLNGVADLCAMAVIATRDPQPQQDWFSRSHLTALRQEAQEAQERYASYRQLREQARTRYEDAFFALDYKALLTRFTATYGTPFRIINPAYYSDLRLLRAELKTPEKLRYEDAVRDLKIGRAIAEQKDWMEAREQACPQNFGRRFEGLETDWAAIVGALEACRQVVDLYGDGRVPTGFIEMLMQPGSALREIEQQRANVEGQLQQAEQEFSTLQRLMNLERLPFTQGSLRTANMSLLKDWLDELAASTADFCMAYDEVLTCRKTGASAETGQTVQIQTMLREAEDIVAIESAVRADAARLQQEFGHLFAGMQTKWEAILAALDWTGKTRNWFGNSDPPPAFVAVVSGQQSGVEKAKSLLVQMRVPREEIQTGVDYVLTLFPREAFQTSGIDIEAIHLPVLANWLQIRLDKLPALEDWLTFQHVCDICAQAGLEEFVHACMRSCPSRQMLKPIFYKRFWALWLDAARLRKPVLNHFNGERHEEIIQQFRDLDKQQIEAAKDRLKHKLLQTSRSANRNPSLSDQKAKLQHEINKIKRHWPIRRLFRETSELLLALKPCLLMSPLSVAQFLDPAIKTLKFDLVVFDEASQIRSEDVIGAIVRGKQLIVVGDNKQLPPSRFFAAVSDGDGNDDTEDDEELAANLFESVLDECEAANLHSEKLRWHYRSRCEALIAFSNHHFYNNDLVTFPGPYAAEEDGSERCVEFVYVPNGIYTRGTGKGYNRIEAQRVAELILQHFTNSPHLSLGIIAFSESQMTAIDDEVRRLRKERPDCERFFAEDGKEPFFIKNLENVQGDERDVIFFSVGYGRDEAGKIYKNFGPLSSAGGERRLNVAVTRAKHKVKLVSSLLPQDLDVSGTKNDGPKRLKDYMAYAQQGPVSLAKQTTTQNTSFDSPFEQEVYNALKARGLTVHTQVGCSGYRIDLAVVDSEHPGSYLMGIECDGKTYHSSRSARDRDRLRQSVLEGLGWRILRVWSSDWIQDREKQLLRIIEALAEARTQIGSTHIHHEPTPNLLLEQLRRMVPAKSEDMVEWLAQIGMAARAEEREQAKAGGALLSASEPE